MPPSEVPTGRGTVWISAHDPKASMVINRWKVNLDDLLVSKVLLPPNWDIQFLDRRKSYSK
jgi:hypothetical protein